LFSRGRPDGLLVGESLIPAVIPLLRELAVEDEVRGYATYKPGATFVLRDGNTISFSFDEWASTVPGYAYNVPRDRFDATLRGAATAAGVQVFDESAQLERDPERPDRVALSAKTSSEVRGFFNGSPDLIVDATGRTRLLARLLGLQSDPGDRCDEALFAHCEGVPLVHDGHVHIDHLDYGWCWRIPLPGRVSVGIVIDPKRLAGLGDKPAERFDACLRSDPHLADLAQASRRVSDVAKYNNYQNTTRRGVGPGWALVGDAFGFIDPIFSSGLYLAMNGARELARAVLDGAPHAMKAYETRQVREYAAWRNLVGYFYDGRLFDLIEVGQLRASNLVGRVMNPHVSKRISRTLTGESTSSGYSQWLIARLVASKLVGSGPSVLAIR
jgi:flavin-dependent dehydrogenase